MRPNWPTTKPKDIKHLEYLLRNKTLMLSEMKKNKEFWDKTYTRSYMRQWRADLKSEIKYLKNQLSVIIK